jgi:hypothetical protein
MHLHKKIIVYFGLKRQNCRFENEKQNLILIPRFVFIYVDHI